MKKAIFFLIILSFLLVFSQTFLNSTILSFITSSLDTSSNSSLNIDNEEVRIKKFPIAVQCWTFRKFTFFETVEKVKELGLEYLQAYPGQTLGGGWGDLRFDHNLGDEHLKSVQEKLAEAGVTLVAYGVVDIGTTEESMRKVFDFARKMGIKTIVTEPKDDDYSLLERLVGEYNIRVAVHNHPEPSKYARPETVLERVRGRDERIGACADTGHWMRSGLKPVEALRLLKGRILDVHLKDRSDFGTENAFDVPFGQGKAGIKDILVDLTLQDYAGFLTIEHENEKDIDNPSPAIRKGLDYIRSIRP